jgi:hypothetical protein
MKVIQYKIDGEVIIEKHDDLFLNQIDEIKWDLAQIFDVTTDDVEVTTFEIHDELSTLDVTSEGLVYFNGTYPNPIIGMTCILKEGSDEYLDAMNDGTILNYIKFVI